MLPQSVCGYCKKVFVPRTRKNKYCNPDCYIANNRRKKLEYYYSHNLRERYKPKTYNRLCPICKKEFIAHNSLKVYCSRDCFFYFYRRQDHIKKKCRVKQKEYYYLHRAELLERNHKRYVPKKKIYRRECNWCNNNFKTNYSWQKSCCLQCQLKFTRLKKHNKYLQNAESNKLRRRINDAKRLYGIGYEEYCDLTKECCIDDCTITEIIDLHHKDGNKQNGGKDNLVGLCPTHHMMIHRLKYSLMEKGKKYVLVKKHDNQ